VNRSDLLRGSKSPSHLLCNIGLGLPPKCGRFDSDIHRLFAISGLLCHHFSRQDIIIGGNSALFTDDHVLQPLLATRHYHWSDQHLGILQINGVDQKRILIHLHLLKTQSSFINERLDLSMKNIAIISSMRKGIVPPVISLLFQFI
jgi:hypothetical protein